MSADSKRAKRASSHQCLFALLGSALVKAFCEMLVKLTPGVMEGVEDSATIGRKPLLHLQRQFLRGDVKASLFSLRDVFVDACDADVVDQSDAEMSLFSNECDDFVLDKSRRELRRTIVNFINILRAAFAPIFFRKKITKPNCN